MAAFDRTYRAHGVVMRRHDIGEADRVLTIFTREYGKIRVIGKGVRKPQSYKAGHLEIFAAVDLMLAKGHTLDVITQADMTESFLPVRRDLLRASYGLHFVELLDAFSEEADSNPGLYRLIVDGLGWLANTTDLRRTARYFELRMLEQAGYRPELARCVVCAEKIEAVPQFYSVADGGVVCPACGATYPRAKAISLAMLKVLRYLQRESFEVVEQLTLGDQVHKECQWLLHKVLSHFLERRLRSADFLERLQREAVVLS